MVSIIRRCASVFFLALALIACILVTAQAQQEDFRLNVHRTFGYGAGSQIRGTFSLDVAGPGSIKSVTYLVDNDEMAKITEAPFNLTFQTTQYGIGWHSLSAVIETTDGVKHPTPPRRYEFVSAEQETSFIVPVVGGILLIVALGLGLQLLILRNRPKVSLAPGAHRHYGMRGGGVCPNCHRPFAIHWWAMNVGLRTKFDHCDFCGKWSLVRQLSDAELASAEAAEVLNETSGPAVAGKSEQDRLKEMIDNSRYTNL